MKMQILCNQSTILNMLLIMICLFDKSFKYICELFPFGSAWPQTDSSQCLP